MSEDQVSKLEKLEKRRQQLAKWKSKQIAGIKAETVSSVAESEKSAEELKKIERQKKLEEWKRRKQQQVKSVSPEITDKPGKVHDLEHVNQDKQLRLDAWKKRKVGIETAIKIVPAVKMKSTKRDVHKKSIFLEDEDESLETRVKPNFKAPLGPSVAKSNYNRADDKPATKNRSFVDQDNKDELDEFLESLEVAESTKKSSEISHMPISDINNPLIGSDLTQLDNSESSGEDEESRLISEKIKNIGKGKELVQVDHEQIKYATFRKTFYTEAPSIKSLSEEDVKVLRLEMDGIKVIGKDVPRPIWEWSQLGLSSLVLSVMEEKLSYTKPTSIQSQALPSIMSGRDFMGVAKTGSGKTLAFVLPLLGHVQDQPPLAKGEGPIAILLTPTRELALQIYKQLCYFTKKLSISACCCYGGSSIEPQIAELKKGSQVVVATPGRLIDLLAANNGRVCNLRRVTYIVLDEADRMFDFGFEPQVQKIFSQIRPDRQSILFSATFAKKMESLARAILHNPVEVVVGGISVVAPEITQHVEFFDVTDELPEATFRKKFDMLLHVLSQYPHVKKLVFVEKQDSADALLVKLLAEKVPCVAIHGGKEQIDRKYAIREFSSKDSAVDVLIATSIAARGLDVKGLDLVVNFDPANHMEDYVHRVGRTGRAGNHGDAYTFVTSDQERPITDLVKALRLSKVLETDIDPKLIHICNNFLEKVKAGKEKFRFGFGGNGLSKLDESRDSAKVLERKAYDVGSEQKKTNNKNTNDKHILEAALDLPEFKVIEGRAEETSGPDKCKFHSRVTINDLPQKARWIVVNADNLAQIIEATSTSITNKGQYYAPKTKIPANIKQGGRDVPPPPKLYLLIEGLTEAAVSEANRMIRQKMIEGLNQASADESSTAPVSALDTRFTSRHGSGRVYKWTPGLSRKSLWVLLLSDVPQSYGATWVTNLSSAYRLPDKKTQ